MREITYTDPAHFQCRVRARRGNDVHAERCPRVRRDQAPLRSVPGSHVADFSFFSLIRETGRPRLESTVLALARPRDVLVQSSATRDRAIDGPEQSDDDEDNELASSPRPMSSHGAHV